MKQLETQSILSPGFAGLNTQESSVLLSTNYGVVTDNAVIDKYGRLGARKGWTQQTTSGSSALSGNYITFLHEHTNADDTKTILSAGNNKIFSGGVGGTLTNITPAGYVILKNDWCAATINDYALIVQEGYEPLVYNAGTLQKYSNTTANPPNFGTNTLRSVIAAYGRFWAHDGHTVYWTTDIADTAFPEFFGGSSGTLNVAAVLPNNVDTIIGLAAHNNFLIIFLKNNILVYNSADDVLSTRFALNDVIAGVGCIARDSIVHTGADLLFLSQSGVRSLGRLIQEKSLPMRDISKNVRDDLVKNVQRELAQDATGDRIKAVYSEEEAFYLLSIPGASVVWCFDMRQALQDGSARVLRWPSYVARALLRRQNGNVLIGKPNSIAKYEGYLDGTQTYTMRFYSPFFDMGRPTVTKIPKKIRATVIGGNGQDFTLKIGYDYLENYRSYPFEVATDSIFEYGVAEYNVAEYTTGVLIDDVFSAVGGDGTIVQIGFETKINGEEFSVQKLDVFYKTGRII